MNDKPSISYEAFFLAYGRMAKFAMVLGVIVSIIFFIASPWQYGVIVAILTVLVLCAYVGARRTLRKREKRSGNG
jgi:membrane protein implicated in regulation of membrane protease activity